MSRLIWDQVGQKIYETGVSNGVLYPIDNTGTYSKGTAWNGLSAVTESPSGAESNKQYADNIEYANLLSIEQFAATIEAFTSPEEFDECDGTAALSEGVYIGQQNRKVFGFVYKTLIGNDIEAQDYGYKLHLVYGCLAAPSEKNRQTINESPEAGTMSWEISTTPVAVTGHKPTAHLVVNSTKVDASKLAQLERILFGADAVEESGTEGQPGYIAPSVAVVPSLPLPDAVAAIFA